MLGPQSTAVFVGLVLAFIALAWWMVTARQPVFRLLAGCLAFIPAMIFGVLAVNKYYGYYMTWGAAITDLTNQGVSAPARVPDMDLTSRHEVGTLDGSRSSLRQAQHQGYLLRLTVTGQRSHLTRVVYVYLPPQYFRPAYAGYRFPVIELIHGQPGVPQDWINVVGVTSVLDQLMATKRAQPAVLVMPDVNGSERVSLQCLNQAHGPQDLTYLAEDLPRRITHLLRVQPPGPAWGVAGYSEGGFCAANMALRFRHTYGFAGVLSGYFKPADNQLEHPIRHVNPFGGSVGLRLENTPPYTLRRLPRGTVLPQFWIAAGASNAVDVANAEAFWQQLVVRQPQAPLILTPGGGHNMLTWRSEVPRMLSWMTPRLALAARHQAALPPKAPSLAREASPQRTHQAALPPKAPALARDASGQRTPLVPLPHTSARRPPPPGHSA